MESELKLLRDKLASLPIKYEVNGDEIQVIYPPEAQDIIEQIYELNGLNLKLKCGEAEIFKWKLPIIEEPYYFTQIEITNEK